MSRDPSKKAAILQKESVLKKRNLSPSPKEKENVLKKKESVLKKKMVLWESTHHYERHPIKTKTKM